ncbi:MAG: glutamate formimidoyltransferase [Elusimicrobia bacterium]|nr:glutamate formimidoyltransferase [Elusimicrobiota bacterium]
MKLIQCVPNFSEGRDRSKVQAIVSAIRRSPGVVVLDVEMDKDHHRSVVTFVGPPEAVVEAAFLAAQKASELIDMNKHKGEHPRMGATDVIPFTPIFGATLQECVDLAKALGSRLAKELKIPVYLYAFAATRPERQNLAVVRKGEYEAIKEAMGKDPSRDPDFGQAQIHPTAGVTAVGAREHIINFNINLDTNDMNLGKEVTKKIRTSGGGLARLRAKEIELAAAGQVQISTVLEDFRVTGIKAVYDKVVSLVRAQGVEVLETELVGMVPARALEEYAVSELQVKGFDPEKQVLEAKILQLLLQNTTGRRGDEARGRENWLNGLSQLCDALAAPEPVPGGGSASAALGAIGVSLALKVFQIQARKNAKQGVDGQATPRIKALLAKLLAWRGEFEQLAKEDAAAFQEVTKAYKIVKSDPGREPAVEAAFKKACDVPLKTLHVTAESATALIESRDLIGASMESDLKVGLGSLLAAASGAKANVLINLNWIKDEKYKNQAAAQAEALEKSLKERF